MSTRRLPILPFLLILLTACAPAAPVASPSAQPPAAPTSSALLEREFLMLAEGEGVLTLQASGPGSSWGRAGAEAAVVSVHVDGNYRADVVLFRGEATGAYEVMLGPLAAGKHRLALQLEPEKSAAGAREVKVTSAEVRAFPQADPLYRAIAHAPILYGRDESARSDTPLLAYHEITPNPGGGETIQYTLVFSNEDGGTEPDGLMVRWGRLVDIEFIYRLTLGPGGEVSNEEYQAKDHKVLAFAGAYEGKHPLLRVATLNNVFADTGTSRFRLALPPLEKLGDTGREEVLDAHPWSYEIMALEWEREAREGTERTPKPGTRAVSDPRNYLYVEFKSGPATGSPCDAKLALGVKVRGDETWFMSDHDTDSLSIQSVGWRRSAIELPPDTKGDKVESLRFTAYPGKNQPKCALAITDIRKAFLLGQDYAPGASLFAWHGRQLIDFDETTPEPREWVVGS